ncbi:MAG: hypothetical protein ABFE08_09725 [Armatimonadia bacterium]
MSDHGFNADSALPPALLGQITQTRLQSADAVRQHATCRIRRRSLTAGGKLVILAADHPGRMVTAALGDPLALANRREYLARILRVLQCPEVDGLMATPDIIEEIIILDLLLEQGLLNERLLIGCMNRGGLAGTAFEMADTFTAYDARGLTEMNLDGAKLMFRLDPQDPASGRTICKCSEAINDCLDHDLAVFLEPLAVTLDNGKYVVQKDAATMARICGVAAALGRSSLNTWLKLPYGPNYDVVARATTCPILMLGGEAVDDPLPLLRDLHTGMAAGPNVCGALIGRNVLFPGTADPAQMARAVAAVIHGGLSAEDAWAGSEPEIR